MTRRHDTDQNHTCVCAPQRVGSREGDQPLRYFEADVSARRDTSRPTFRPGDDRIVLNAETELECDGKIDFGDGNDAMSIGDDAEAYLQDFFVMGAGNDTLNIEKGGYVFAGCNMDFGTGNDSLILNGTLQLSMGGALSGLENLSGSGQLLVAYRDDVAAGEFKRFTDAGIDVIDVGVCRGESFTDRTRELQDNTLQSAFVMEWDDDEYDEEDFWLSGTEWAKNRAYGFADEVDYVKFTRRTDCDLVWINVEGDGFMAQLLDAGGNVLGSREVTEWSCEFDLDELGVQKGATCYVKLSVAANSQACGWVEVMSGENHRIF